MRCGIVSDDGALLARWEGPTNAKEGPEAVLARMADGVASAAQYAGLDLTDIRAIGVGVPGPLDSKAGIVHSAPNMPGWEHVPVSAILREKTGISTFLENDANCAGWGEFRVGAGSGTKHMLMITLGTGIGGAVIIDGKLFTGRDGTAGELGHVCIKEGGRLCGCGARGCVEAYASASATVARFLDLINIGWRTPLAEKGLDLTCADIFHAAAEGDPVAIYIVEETGRYLGVLAASMANLLNPECCVISGGMIQAGETLFGAIRTVCQTRCFTPGKTMAIVPAQLGANAGLIGAAGQAMERWQAEQSVKV